MSKRVIISGGGTGGHIFPAIAIGKALLRLDSGIQILFVGASGGMEMILVPKYDFPIRGVTVSGLMRRITLKNILKNIVFPFKLLIGMRQARRIVKEFNPDVVVGVGGFASGPVGKVATRLNIPLVICEANAYPGMTNKLLAPKAALVLLGNEAAMKYFPNAKVKVSGNPVRENLGGGNRGSGLRAFGLEESKKVVLALGGSLGAGSINNALLAHLDLFIRNDVQLIWQCGKRYYEELSAKVPKHPLVKLLPFIDNMADAFAASDLVITRAGASTLSELILLNKPAILVPSPNVAEDHQTKNAMSLVVKNAAVMVKDTEAMDKLAAEAVSLVRDEARLETLREGILKTEKLDSANMIAGEIMRLIKS